MEFISLLLLALVACVNSKPAQKTCDEKELAKYNITIETFWTEDKFPKQFPTFRPHAQWAKMIGRTHSDGYRLWEQGELASAGVREYVELGTTEELDAEVQGLNGILDIFNTRSLNLGVGSASVKVLMDPYHDKVSMMARLVPSPDWFVGVDSLSLCRGGRWVPKLSLDLHPYDAGTDRGFTFTAPNWPEIPYKAIYQITSKLPNHPANSFFYPELEELPVIARFSAIKVDTVEKDSPKSFERDATAEASSTMLTDDRRQQQQQQQQQRQQQPQPQVASFHSHSEVMSQAENKLVERKPEFSLFRTDMRPRSYTRPQTPSTPTPRPYRPDSRREEQSDAAHPQSCTVSAWQEWSPCSKTCGYGSRVRTRTEVTAATNGGAPCPVLTQQEICGSMRNCTWNHFKTFQGGSSSGTKAGAAKRRRFRFRRRKNQQQQQQQRRDPQAA